MKIKLYLIIGLAISVLSPLAAKEPFKFPRAKLTVRVLDEQGMPLPGAEVTFTFLDSATREGVPVRGLTDANGEFSGEGDSDSYIGGSVQKEGYYRGGFPFVPFRETKDGRWLPWNPTYQAILRKIEKPIPLVAKRLRKLTIPVVGQPCGYDLEVGDWVSPYGKGKVPDFVFTAKREYESWDKFDVSIIVTFSNQGDGIQIVTLPEEWSHNIFKWPRLAPESGYESSASSRFWAMIGSAYHSTATDNQAYFFRVRTVKKGDRIMSALYGKIFGGIQLEARDTKTVDVAFTYYLNSAALDRNLEWNPTKNLLTGLKAGEKPNAP